MTTRRRRRRRIRCFPARLPPARLAQVATFSEFRIESKTGNVICLHLSLSNLAHAMRAGLGAHSTTIKLTKRGGAPFLSIATQMVEGGIEVAQDVPVRVLGAAEMERYREPALGPVAVRARRGAARCGAARAERCDRAGWG